MGRARHAVAAIAMGAVALLASACYPPSQTPQPQSVPPGGRIVATTPALTELEVADANDDLSVVLFRRNDVLISVSDPIPYRFWVYDDVARTTTEMPMGRAEWGAAALSPDARSVVFSSNDRSLQVGPVASNCRRGNPPWTPLTYVPCSELYLFDRDTGQVRQLTGLTGSSLADHADPRFTDDGTGVTYASPDGRIRLDLTTGELSLAPVAPPCCTWDRGTRHVVWDPGRATLTSEDATTGVVTTLWSTLEPWSLEAAADDGRWVVLSRWETDQKLVRRLVNTDTGVQRVVKTPWFSQDGSRYALVQLNVAPEGIDRLILAPA